MGAEAIAELELLDDDAAHDAAEGHHAAEAHDPQRHDLAADRVVERLLQLQSAATPNQRREFGRAPRALILAPTRELALQVSESFQSFADHLGGVSVLPIYGGQAYGIQLSGLRRGAQVIVGTPGRVIDHLEKGSLDLSQLQFLVLDEADEMLNMGFQEDVERILEDTPDRKQVALFSATMPNAIRRLSKRYLDNPAEVTVKSERRTNDNITQRFLLIPHRAKMDAFTRILEVTEFEVTRRYDRYTPYQAWREIYEIPLGAVALVAGVGANIVNVVTFGSVMVRPSGKGPPAARPHRPWRPRASSGTTSAPRRSSSPPWRAGARCGSRTPAG